MGCIGRLPWLIIIQRSAIFTIATHRVVFAKAILIHSDAIAILRMTIAIAATVYSDIRDCVIVTIQGDLGIDQFEAISAGVFQSQPHVRCQHVTLNVRRHVVFGGIASVRLEFDNTILCRELPTVFFTACYLE